MISAGTTSACSSIPEIRIGGLWISSMPPGRFQIQYFPMSMSLRRTIHGVLAIINGMARGQFDAIAFTSAPQVRRLREVAHATGRESDLLQGFKRIVVAAVGPIVASKLE